MQDEQLKELSMPKHIAIIMDGNRRWANINNQSIFSGYEKGSERIMEITESCLRKKIPYLTIYVFSTENWIRPKVEVSFLINLLKKKLKKNVLKFKQSNCKVAFIGSLAGLDNDLINEIKSVEQETIENSALELTIAFNYGGRAEIVDTVKKVADLLIENKVKKEEINEDYFRNMLYMGNKPDPDLLIRTGGYCRISNFLLWYVAYSEIFFSNRLWPDFDEDEFSKALSVYASTKRNMGA